MAKALQCPSCGTKTRLDSHGAGETFSCERCGQTLKVPPGMGRRGASGGGGDGGGSSSKPVPPRRQRPVMTAGGGVAAGGTAVLSAPAAVVPAPGAVPPIAPPPSRDPGAGSGRDALPLPLRILVWIIALPIGLAIVGIPARGAGYLSSQKLLDVIVKHDLSRFVPLVVIVALWALVTALLVTLFVEGGRRWMLRRRSKGPRGDGGIASAAGPAPEPPPRRSRAGRRG